MIRHEIVQSHSMATVNLKKVRTWWQIPPQNQSTCLGGPESASIEILSFRPFLWCKFPKIKIFKNFRITPNFFFALKYIKSWTKVVPWNFFFRSRKIFCYSRVRNKHTGTLINFWGFFLGLRPYSRGYVYWFLIFKNFFTTF